MSLIPVIVPIYLRTPDSSVSNIILNRMPSETCMYIALLYLAKGITNSEGLALKTHEMNVGTESEITQNYRLIVE